MIQNDLIFVEKLLKNSIINSPLLELGSGYGGETCRDLRSWTFVVGLYRWCCDQNKLRGLSCSKSDGS
jgi:hypothetical protein